MIRLWPFHTSEKLGRKEAVRDVEQKNDELRDELAMLRRRLMQQTTRKKMEPKTDG